MRIQRLNAARLHYESIAAQTEEEILIYLSNAVGIGEHPQIMEELRGLIEKLANANDCIETIDELIKKYDTPNLTLRPLNG